jgi:hypothetical protein
MLRRPQFSEKNKDKLEILKINLKIKEEKQIRNKKNYQNLQLS